MNKITNKKIVKLNNTNKIFKLYIEGFETKSYYISYKLFKVKKKQKKKNVNVEYLKTSRYVIPLPSEDEPKKKIKNKDKLPSSDFLNLYDFYDNFMSNHYLFFYSNPWIIYNPGKLPFLNKFDYNLRFEIYRALRNVYCLLAESSFSKNYLKFYFSTKKFKFYSLVYFWDMFKKYRNPNLPLPRRRGESFVTKVEGTALLKVWEIIFWQLVLEEVGLTYQFSNSDLNFFYRANIDPQDPWYFWPTRRFNILGFSSHDGWIYTDIPKKFFRDFSEIPSTEIKPETNASFKKQILAQYLHWKNILLKLIKEQRLIYHISSIFTKDNYFYTIKNASIPVVPKMSNYLLGDYMDTKLNKYHEVTYLNFPLPDFYYGEYNEFTKEDFLNKDIKIINKDKRLRILLDNWIPFFLKNFPFFQGNFVETSLHELRKFMNYYIFTDKNKDSIRFVEVLPNTSTLTNKVSKPFPIVNSNLTPLKVIKILKKKNFNNKVITKKIYKIPFFIKDFFFLLLQINLDDSDIEKYCLNHFLTILPSYNYEIKKAKEEVNNFLGPLQVFKSYFEISDFYNLSDPTIAYKALKEVLKNFPNKDIIVWRTEPYGINPFYVMPKILAKTNVPFNYLISDYTYYKYIEELNWVLLPTKPILNIELSIFNYDLKIFKKNYLFFFQKKLSFLYFSNAYWEFLLNFLNLFKIKKFNKNIANRNLSYLIVKFAKNKTFKTQFSSFKKYDISFNYYSNFEETTVLDFLLLNPTNYLNYSSEELQLIRTSNLEFLKREFFLKWLEKEWTMFIVVNMHKLLWLNYYFKQQLISLDITKWEMYCQDKSLYFNIIENQKIFDLNNFYVGSNSNNNFLFFLRSYYFSKYFFNNFSIIFQLNLKKNYV